MMDYVEPEETPNNVKQENPYTRIFNRELQIKLGWWVKINLKPSNEVVELTEMTKA